jgi:hypothetical protein
MKTAEKRELEHGLQVLVVNSVYFCASKLEAFRDRGKNDYLGSRDLEDVTAIVDGRPELAREIRAASNDVRSYIAEEIGRLCATREFVDALPGHLPPDSASQERITVVMARLREIASF